MAEGYLKLKIKRNPNTPITTTEILKKPGLDPIHDHKVTLGPGINNDFKGVDLSYRDTIGREIAQLHCVSTQELQILQIHSMIQHAEILTVNYNQRIILPMDALQEDCSISSMCDRDCECDRPPECDCDCECDWQPDWGDRPCDCDWQSEE